MDIKNFILTDAGVNAIDNGVWVGNLPNFEDAELLVTGTGSKEARDLLDSKRMAMRVKSEGKPITNEQAARIMREVLAEVVLKDWRGITSDGKEVPYSKELATKWLTSRHGETFADIVLTAAQRVDNEANKLAEETVKN